MKTNTCHASGYKRLGTLSATVLAMFFWSCILARAIQFDAFLGFDGSIRVMNWFPVVIEVANDGPTFNAIVQISSAQFVSGQTRRVSVELPTNTRKRIVIPVFASGRYASWEATLYDDKGKKRAEQVNLKPRQEVLEQSTLVGAIPRNFSGLPVLPEVGNRQDEFRPAVCHFRPELFPDTPLTLEALNCLYLNTEKALELTPPQANALLAWLHQGGHLIVAIEQSGDLNGLPWLKAVLPIAPQSTEVVQVGTSLHACLLSITNSATVQSSSKSQKQSKAAASASNTTESKIVPDFNEEVDHDFAQSSLAVCTGPMRQGVTVAQAGGIPLIQQSPCGRGRVTCLTFSPEREPFRSWKLRPWFWVYLANIPPATYTEKEQHFSSSQGLDAVFASLLESHQIRKLPAFWLLVLLIAYLAVIGPVDQYYLRKINRTMLTWITFPTYVVLFSLLIYFIGYRLRSGDTEWNELHVVDIHPRGDRAQLRGNTYATIYSPINAHYKVEARLGHASLRGESQGSWGGGQESCKADVQQNDAGFAANLFAPVWTSQLFVYDWWQTAPTPLEMTVDSSTSGEELVIRNHLDRSLTNARLIVRDRIYTLGELKAGQVRRINLAQEKGEYLVDFVQRVSQSFSQIVNQRRQAFGRNAPSISMDMSEAATAAGFVKLMQRQGVSAGYYGGMPFTGPKSMDVAQCVDQGYAVLCAWDEGHAPIQPIRQFNPKRSQQHSIYRVATPLRAP